MAYVLWQIGAILWIVLNGNIPFAMMYSVVGAMYAKDARGTTRLVGMTLQILAVVLAALVMLKIL